MPVGGARRGLRVPPASPRPGRAQDECGAVIAETAVVLPVLVLMVLGLAWMLSLGVAQVRVVDAARETARALARDEETGRAVAIGERVAPEGAVVSVVDLGDSVRVRVVAVVRGPAGLFAFLPSAQVEARSVAAKEPS